MRKTGEMSDSFLIIGKESQKSKSNNRLQIFHIFFHLNDITVNVAR